MSIKITDKVNVRPLLERKGFSIHSIKEDNSFHIDERDLHEFMRLVTHPEAGHIVVVRSHRSSDGGITTVLGVMRPPTDPNDPCTKLLQFDDE